MPTKTPRTADARGATLGERVYREILTKIAEGAIHPNEYLREADLCQQLNVSRTPVREAIRRLHAEGRVVIEPHRGAVVAELALHEIVELYTLRLELEGFAAALAAQHATEAEIRLMETLLDQSRQLDDDPRALNNNNWRLHKAIQIAAHNRFLSQTFEALSGSLALLRGVKYIPKDRPASLLKEHQAILDGIRERSPEKARKAAEAHVNHAFQIHMMTSLNDARH